MQKLTTFETWWLNAWPHRWHLRQRVPKFLRACPEPFRGEVLEVGAGPGWTSRAILETFPQVELTATDVDEGALVRFTSLQGEYGRRLKVQSADILNLPFDRASFDIVVAFHVMHHVADVEKAIIQCMRVLRPGGLLGLADQDQRFIVGPLQRLFKPTHHLLQEELAEIVGREATIRVSEGSTYFYLWAQKAFPF